MSFLFALKGWTPGGRFLGPIFGYPPFWARLLPMYLAGALFFCIAIAYLITGTSRLRSACWRQPR